MSRLVEGACVVAGVSVLGFAGSFFAGQALAQAQTYSDDGIAQTQAETSQTAVDLDEIVVTDGQGSAADGYGYAPKSATVGGKEPVPLLETPNSVTVVTRKRMDEQNVTTIEEALELVPGVSVVPWDTSAFQFWSRGSILDVTYDGVPSYNTSSPTPEFDMAIYERLEVQRGPAGLLKGVGRPGGSVNLVRKRGLDDPAAAIALSAGSWENFRGELDVGGSLTGDGNARSRFVVVKQNRSYFHHPSEYDKELAYGAIDFDLTDRTTLSLAATYQNAIADSPSMGLPAFTNGQFMDVPRSTHVYPDWTQYRYESWDVSAELRHEFDSGWVFNTKFHHRGFDWFWKDSYPTTGVDPVTYTASYARRSADWDVAHTGYDAYFSGPVEFLGREHSVLFGYNFERNGSTGKTVTLSPHLVNVPIFDPNSVPEPDFVYTNGYDDRNEQSGFYGQVRLRITDPLILVLGGRLSDFDADSRSIAPSPETPWRQGAKEENVFTPYTGIVYYVTPTLTAYASYADLFIPQTQRMANGQVLDPRVGAQHEVGLKSEWFDRRLNASIAAFRTRETNRSMPDTSNPGFFVPIGEVEVKGIEVEFGGSPLHNLQIAGGYTWLDTTYIRHQSLEGEIFSLFEPEHSLKSYVRYSFEQERLEGLSVSAGLHYSSGMIGTGTAERRQGDYVVVNGQVDYRITPDTNLSLEVTNIFDEKYYARVGGMNTYNFYGEPRAAMLTLRSRL